MTRCPSDLRQLGPWRAGVLLASAAAFVGGIGWSIAEAEPIHRELIAPPLADPSPRYEDLGRPIPWEAPPPCPPARAARATSPPIVDLNRASSEQLTRLPGIGPSKANRIVQWRKRHGPFRRVVDLRRVRGFGRTTVTHLKPYLRIQ